jgi:arsenite methyltransferase
MERTMTAESKFWDAIAEKYAAKPVADVPAYERKLAITKARLRREHVVLDVGCGTGSLALELAPHVAHVHSLDVSAEMIRIAKGKAAAKGVDNVTFHHATLEAITSFEPAQFDAVCAYNILHLVDDRRRTLATMFELLKPGGAFVSSTPCLGDSLVPYAVILPVMRWFGKAPPVCVLDRATLTRDIREAGFDDVTSPDVGADALIAFMVAGKPR